MDHSEYSVSSESDDEQGVVRGAEELNGSINETAVSFGVGLECGDNPFYEKSAKYFEEFFSTNIDRPERVSKGKKLENSRVFQGLDFKAYEPSPKVYFLPTTILLFSNVAMIDLRDRIIDEQQGRASVTLKVNKKNRLEELFVKMHTKNYIEYYKIRKVIKLEYEHQFPYCLDQELIMAPLYHFYATKYEKKLRFEQTTKYLLYWAYRKNLLDDYLSEWAIKLLVIYYYLNLGKGLPNIIDSFKEGNKKSLESLKKMYSIDKNLNCKLNPQLFKQSNFSVKKRKGFYVKSTRKYADILQIYPIPYPIVEKEKKKRNKEQPDKQKQNENKRHEAVVSGMGEVNPITVIIKIMQYFNNNMQKAKRVVINLAKQKKGVEILSDLDFNLEIIHPVFGNNLCSDLTEDSSKRNRFKTEVNKIITVDKEAKEANEVIKKMFA